MPVFFFRLLTVPHPFSRRRHAGAAAGALRRGAGSPGLPGIPRSAFSPALAGRCSYGGPSMVQHLFGKIWTRSFQRGAGPCPARHMNTAGPEPGETALPGIAGILGGAPRFLGPSIRSAARTICLPRCVGKVCGRCGRSTG
eukprot:gene14251-biopygen20092